jgi:hypothetical protein
MAACATAGCEQRAQIAVKTGGRDSVRGMSSTVYYEPENAPRGAEPLCAPHGTALLGSLIGVLT